MNKNNVVAKLYCIQSEFKQFNLSDGTMDQFLDFCRGQLSRFDNTFIPDNRKEEAVNELALFLLNERSAFDRFINN